MDHIDWLDLIESYNRRIRARVDWSGHYKHPSGVGDERESAIIESLREVFPPKYGFNKGKIIDSEGNVSKEVDIIIFEKNVALSAMNLAGRIVIPVESVYGIIEIKSYLDKRAYQKSLENILSISKLRRFYIPVAAMNHFTAAEKRKLNEGVVANDSMKNMGKIWSMIIAFDAVKPETIASYLFNEPPPEEFHSICIPSRSLIVKWAHPPGFKGLQLKERSFGILTWFLISLLNDNIRSEWYKPNYSKYREIIVDALDEIETWSMNYK